MHFGTSQLMIQRLAGRIGEPSQISETIPGSYAQPEQQRHSGNAEYKIRLENMCQCISAVGILCEDKSWALAN